jgi:ATP synthase protein I
MPQPDETSDEALRRLDQRLDALQASRAKGPVQTGDLRGAAAGYRFLGEVVGGVLGGAGLGWLVDQFLHTAPLGLLAGLLIGTAASITVAIIGAVRASKAAAERSSPLPSVPDDEDE